MKKNNYVPLWAVFLCVVLISATGAATISVTSEQKDTTAVYKVLDATPEHDALETFHTVQPQSLPTMQSADVPVINGPEDEFTPGFAKNPDGEYLMGHTVKADVTEYNLPFLYSADGETFAEGLIYDIVGTESYPAIDYRGIGKEFVGTLQGDPVEDDGSRQYLFRALDPADTETWTLTYWTWGASYPYKDRRIPDIAGYGGLGLNWWCHITICSGTRDIRVDMPIFNYPNYDDSQSGWSSYFDEYQGCENAVIEIDPTNGYFYAVLDYYNNQTLDWDLLLFRGECQDNGEGYLTHFDQTLIGESENTKYPAVGAIDDKIIILSQTDEAGTQDIVCYYSDDAGDSFSKSFVADDTETDELYPTIHSYGDYATATFIADNNLYVSYTEDGGANWSTPEQVNDNDGSVTDEFRYTDNTAGGQVIWTDDQAGNLDLYVDNVGGQPPTPALELGNVAGGFGKVSATITNVGDAPAPNVDWTITVTGGIIGRINKETNGTITSIDVGGEESIATDGIIFGLGKLTILYTASCPEAEPTTVELEATGTLFIVFILNVAEVS